MALYKIYKDPSDGNKVVGVNKDLWNNTTIGILLENNEDNTDLQEYLKWVEAGNTAEAAD